jgi:hypothetical protein
MIFNSDPRFFYDPATHAAERHEFLEAQIDLAIKMGYECHVYDIEKLDFENQFGPTYMVEAEYAGADAAAAKDAIQDNPYVEFVGKHSGDGDFPSAAGVEFKVGQADVF